MRHALTVSHLANISDIVPACATVHEPDQAFLSSITSGMLKAWPRGASQCPASNIHTASSASSIGDFHVVQPIHHIKRPASAVNPARTVSCTSTRRRGSHHHAIELAHATPARSNAKSSSSTQISSSSYPIRRGTGPR